MTESPATAALIAHLGLERHREGGYYRRIFSGTEGVTVDTRAGSRPALTSIQYLLTTRSPVGHFHSNRSTIVHYFQLGDPVIYRLLTPRGKLTTQVLGPDLDAGQQLALVVPGEIWKSSELVADGSHGYSLVAEAVSPGFDYSDMVMATGGALALEFPRHESILRRLCIR